MILRLVWWKIKCYRLVGVILIETVSEILVHGDNRFGIIVTGGHFSEEFGLCSVEWTKKVLGQTGQVLVSLTPSRIVWAGLIWIVCPGMSGYPRNNVHPVKHRGQVWPDWLDPGFPDPAGTAYPPNHVDARANDQNVCKGVFCSIVLAFRRLRWSPTTLCFRKGGQRVLWGC